MCERIRMCWETSECIRTYPNRSKQDRTRQKTSNELQNKSKSIPKTSRHEAVEKIPPEKRTPVISGEQFFGDPKFSPNPRFVGRTDLWISLSRAKFDEEVDFEVRLGVALQKRQQIGKKQNFRSKVFVDLVRVWRTYGRTDVKISFLVKFCSR